MEITNVKKINQLDAVAGLPSGKKNKNLLATITDPDTGKTYKGSLKELLDLLIPPSTAASPSIVIQRGVATTTPQEGISNVGGELYFNGKPLRSTAIVRAVNVDENIDEISDEGRYSLWHGRTGIKGLPSNFPTEFMGNLDVSYFGGTTYQEITIHAGLNGAGGVYRYFRYKTSGGWTKYSFIKIPVLP